MILIVLFSKIRSGDNMLYLHEIKDITIEDLPKKNLNYGNIENADERFITGFNMSCDYQFQYSNFKNRLYDEILNSEKYKLVKENGFNLTYIIGNFLIDIKCLNIEDLEIVKIYHKYRTNNHLIISKKLKLDLCKLYDNCIIIDAYDFYKIR
jgi:hypothetical protein